MTGRKNYIQFSTRKIIASLLLLSCTFHLASAQDCPRNIDFENGTFSGWNCYTGNVRASDNQNIITLTNSGGPETERHEMFSLATSGSVFDYYGSFPVVCPNGSGYSVKLGNTSGGAQAEGLSYQFTIPAGRDNYTLTYHYAVVFQDPAHYDYQQPRLELEVRNVTDDEIIECSSFTFFPNGSPLPGFYLSPKSDSIPVWCKDWSPVSINLNGKGGKTIQLFFKTADCTFTRHFGYAYLDVDSDCSGEFIGAKFCPDDTAVVITAPYGYEIYKWFDSSFNILGNQPILTLTPPPPSGTSISVEVTPFLGYGCKDTLTAVLIDTLTLKARAGKDIIFCKDPVIIGENTRPGIVYNWSPATGLNDPTRSNPMASPQITTRYVLTVRSLGGGCINSDTVIVSAAPIDTSLQLLGKPAFCVGNGDSAALLVNTFENVEWYRNNALISNTNGVRLPVYKSGDYFARVFNTFGCSIDTRIQKIDISVPRPGIRYPLQYALFGEETQLQARTFSLSVLWDPPVYLTGISTVNPIFNANTELSQEYTIRLVTNEECVTVDTLVVKTIKEVKVYIPTAYTPNNDGLNDYFKPIMFGIKEVQSFKVFNRWGQLMYDYKWNSKGWDGTFNGTPQQPGVYVWMMQATGIDNKTHFQKGTILLAR